MSLRTGVELIAAERERQVKKLNWSPEHDDEHDAGELAAAAACYAAPERIYTRDEYADSVHFVDPFPWPDGDRRPYDGNVLKTPTHAQRVRLLEKAGALIAAEIDRLIRLRVKQHEEREATQSEREE